MNYFVITERQAVITASAFTQSMKSRWPRAMVEEVRNPASSHVLEFSVPMGHGDVTGSLNREGCSIAFIGDIQDCADFTLWCRELLPPGEPATFCDESMSGCLDLTASTTLNDIFHVFGHQVV
ncbi:hypothetical protein [Cystobacter ferrugineus]|uniref:Uncharacterized protein n=1 Tax=Cystobacter ferrugineus TaxID=83449 RepID=A0A1L9ATY3_9BACT|nr:hypothetical protein [Cystobacter ferrugineus]OJH33442.1 hypothetical protein BON30_48600 [Cystobacter ferrugineus]